MADIDMAADGKLQVQRGADVVQTPPRGDAGSVQVHVGYRR